MGYPGLGGYGYDTCWINEEWTPPTATKVRTRVELPDCSSSTDSLSSQILQLEVYSPGSGIKLAVTSNQRAIQIYVRLTPSYFCPLVYVADLGLPFGLTQTCGGQHGTIPVKSTQGTGFVEQNSCMVIEMEDVIGGECFEPTRSDASRTKLSRSPLIQALSSASYSH